MKFSEYTKTQAWKKLPSLKLSPEHELENAIRDHLSGTKRKVDKNGMYNLLNKPDKKIFNKVWKSLIDDDYLIKVGKYYKWEM